MNQKPFLTINPLFDDGFTATTRADYYAIAMLSGTAINVESGNYVQVALNGQTYQGLVDKNGEWSIPLPPSTITSLINTDPSVSHNLLVSVTNNQGESTEQSRQLSVPDISDGRVAGIGINPIAGNDEIIGREKLQAQVISGLTQDVPEGTLVTVHLAGQTREVPVDSNGTWSFTLTPQEMKALAPGEYTLTVQLPYTQGEPLVWTNRTFNVTKDKGTSYAAEIAINTISGDDVLMADEQKSGLIVSGTTVNVASGKEVWVQLGEHIYAATVKNNHWQTKIPAEDLAQLHNGSATLLASVKDLHETATAVHKFGVGESLTMPHLSLNDAYDNFSAEDAQWSLLSETLSGTVTRVPAGTLVTVQLGTLTWETPVGNNGNWQLPISPADLMSQSPGALPLTVSVSNDKGETATSTHTISYHGFDTEAQTLLVMNPVSGNDVISSREKNVDIAISGATLNVPEGQEVNVTIKTPYDSLVLQGKVDVNGEWAVTLSPKQLNQFFGVELTVEAAIKNDAQWQNPNGEELSASRTLHIDRNLDYGEPIDLHIDNVRDGQHISLNEFPDGLTIKGGINSTSYQYQVTVQIGEWSGTTETTYDRWEITIPPERLAALREGRATIETTLFNRETGDTTSEVLHVVFERPIVVPEEPQITLDPVMGTDHITEVDAEQPYALTGTVTGKDSDWGDLSVELNGQIYRASFANGKWLAWVPGDEINALPAGEQKLTVHGWSRVAGDTLTSEKTVIVDADSEQPPFGVSISAVQRGNELISWGSLESGLNIFGTTLSSTPAGTRVDIAFHGKHYQTATVGTGSWELTIPAEDLVSLPLSSSELITATLGEPGQHSLSDARMLTFVDDIYDYTPYISFDRPYSQVINPGEIDESLVIRGNISNLRSPSTVLVEFGDKVLDTTTDKVGYWSVRIPTSVLSAMHDGVYALKVTTWYSDRNADVVKLEKETPLVIDTDNNTLPVLTIDTVTGDNILLPSEIENGFTLSGSVTNVMDGSNVGLDLGDRHYSAEVTKGRWQITLTPEELPPLALGEITLSAEANSYNGKTVTTHTQITVSVPDQPQITLDPVTEGNFVTRAFSDVTHYFTGTIAYDLPGAATLILNGKSYQASVANGMWTAAVPGADIAALPDGQLPVTVTWHRFADNTSAASATSLLKIVPGSAGDSYPVGVTLDAISDDNLVTRSEISGGLLLSGSALSQRTVSPGDDVDLLINGKHYHTQMTHDGEGATPRWSLLVPAADLADSDSAIIKVTSRGLSASSELHIVADGQEHVSPPRLTIDPLKGYEDISDDVITSSSIQNTFYITGSSENLTAGSQVEVSMNGLHWRGTVNEKGDWSVWVYGDPLIPMEESYYQLSATSVDAVSGERAWVERTMLLDHTQKPDPLIRLNDVTGDNILQPAELDDALTISGKMFYFEPHQTLYISLLDYGNGPQLFYETQTQADGSWRLDLPAGAWSGLTDHHLLTVTGVDSHGKLFHLEQDLSLPASGESTLTSLADLGLSGGENAISALLSQSEETQSTHVTADAPDSLALPTASNDLWTTMPNRSEVDTTHYPLAQQQDLTELLAQQTPLA
ncbi:hypothetical protein B1H58_06900 [Pantoea alhagi]|uniref:Bacterial Ig-like domain-containing protein n=1 Tax=Pantoea alhagi TaxID=1891675 RepID=A0A1W6B3X7_9GAMM|nr:hypothetical protein [Pantoea alhagi]ARJ41776.1 hypothetical protein B1H58_06900 [Pantoea alhagi]